MRYVPKFQVGKNGEWKLGKSYRNAEGMEAAYHDIAKVLADIGNAMKTGNLSPTPQKDLDPCAYCRCKAVCRSAVPQKNR
jgi:hypothetical protein